MTMAVTTSALPMQPIYVSAGSCSTADVSNLQRRRLRQQEPQELSLTRPTDTAASSSSIRDEPVRTPLSANVLLSLPASPKRSSASHSSSSKTPAISKSQMKGELRFKIRSHYENQRLEKRRQREKFALSLSLTRHESYLDFRLVFHLSYGKFFDRLTIERTSFFESSRNSLSDGQSACAGKTCYCDT